MKTKLFAIILILGLAAIANSQPGRDVVWAQEEDALHPFFCAGSGVLGNYYYCFGTDASVRYAQAFNLTTGQWEESTLPPIGWGYFSSVTTDGAIYLLGRNSYNPFEIGPEVQRFIPIGGGPTGTWTVMEPYPLQLRAMASAWDGGNYIYAAGGLGAAGYADAYKYDIANNNWTQIANMPDINCSGGGAFLYGRFYVVGGEFLSNVLFEYNPGTNTWATKTGPLTPVLDAIFCTTCNDSLMFTVGGGASTSSSAAVQVYNPLTDNWTLETSLPQAVSWNCARFIPPNKIISAGGFVPGLGFSAATYLGDGFPTGPSGLPHLTFSLIPFTQPIQIPASGGSFSFYAFVTNNDPTSHDVQLWTKIIDPTSYTIQPVLGPAMVTLPPGTRGWVRHQNIPGEWISGQYTYVGCAGFYPSSILASDSLQFTKLTTGDGPWVDNWSCSGEEIGNAEKTLINHHSTLSTSVQPNPFNPTTVVSFELRDASYVSLRIYDTAGRLVETLVNGWRDAGDHQITFDGSGLPSGIYFAKLTAGDFSQVQKLVLLK